MYVLVGVVVHVELVDAIQVVFALTEGFAGAGATRNLVVGRVSPGRNTENTDSRILVVLNNSRSVST